MTVINVPVLSFLKLSHVLSPAYDRMRVFEQLYKCTIMGEEGKTVKLRFDSEYEAMMFLLREV